MAEIDKSLPNVKQTINVPSPEEVQVELQEEQQPDQPIDIQPNEDGSVDVNFDPKVGSLPQTDEHFANLAELLPDEVLGPIGNLCAAGSPSKTLSIKDAMSSSSNSARS